MAALPSENEISAVSADVTFDRDEAKNGDGRRRLRSVGLNPVREQYSITYAARTLSEANTLISALKALQGVTAVQWTPPHESTSRDWTVERIQHQNSGMAAWKVSATLVEDF